jgi:hypothetical protein
LDPERPAGMRLIALLGYGQEDRRGRRRRGKPMPEKSRELAQRLKSILAEGAESDSVLPLFNHLQGGGTEQQWLIVPYEYTFSNPDDRLYGTIRIRYDLIKKKPDRVILLVNNEQGSRWWFVIEPNVSAAKTSPVQVSVFSRDQLNGGRGLVILRSKLQNLGVEIDDTIREDHDFDGFSLPGEGLNYKAVNTEG